jgi:hypothetical protein
VPRENFTWPLKNSTFLNGILLDSHHPPTTAVAQSSSQNLGSFGYKCPLTHNPLNLFFRSVVHNRNFLSRYFRQCQSQGDKLMQVFFNRIAGNSRTPADKLSTSSCCVHSQQLSELIHINEFVGHKLPRMSGENIRLLSYKYS